MTKKLNIRNITICGIMSAISFVLMMFEISVPLMPGFIKLDFSEIPALITSFAIGPLYAVLVCLIKNLLHLFVSQTLFIGELANFLLGAFFVGTAGIIYKRRKTRRGALIASVVGSFSMAIGGVFINFLIIYPLYSIFLMPSDVILSLYRTILPSINNLFSALVIFNLPFTFIKGLIDSAICFAIYKHISPILKKKQ